jgi:hypothetical protein
LSSTATQKEGEGHDTASSPYPELAGRGADHELPLNITERFESSSTAMQKEVVGQETAVRPPETPSIASTSALVDQELPLYV